MALGLLWMSRAFRKENEMISYMKKYVLVIVTWFVVAAMLSLIIHFFAHILSMGWGYKSIIWPVYLWGLLPVLIIEVAIDIFILRWIKVYKRELCKGRREEAASDSACEEIRVRAPKWLLRGFAKLVYGY